MNRKITVFLAIIFASVFSSTAISRAQNMDANQVLNSKQQSIITIAAFTANGNMEKLQTALNEGLDAGLSINASRKSWFNCMLMRDSHAV